MTESPRLSSRLLLLATIIFWCVSCDQVTKKIATEQLRPKGRMSFLGDTVRIQYARNPGAFLGMASGLSSTTRFWLLVVMNAVLMSGVAGVLIARWNMPRWQFVALAAILGGGIGNLIDRLYLDGQVTDFLNLGVGVLRTGIFNLADVAITGGVIALVAGRASWKQKIAAAESPVEARRVPAIRAEHSPQR